MRISDWSSDVCSSDLKGDLEVAIVGVPGELAGSLHQLPIFEERFLILLPPNHRLVAFDEIPATELDKEPYVNRSNCEVFELVQKELDRRGISLRKVFSSPRDDWVQGMVQAGLGYGFFQIGRGSCRERVCQYV